MLTRAGATGHPRASAALSGDVLCEPVQDLALLVLDLDDERHLSRHRVRRAAVLLASAHALPVLYRDSTHAFCPGTECVAHAMHGSYALNAISTMFRRPSETFPFLMSPLAAFSTDMQMAAELLTVATMRFAFVMTPRSSVL